MGRWNSKPEELTPEEEKLQWVNEPNIPEEEMQRRHKEFTQMIMRNIDIKDRTYISRLSPEVLDDFKLGLILYHPEKAHAVSAIAPYRYDHKKKTARRNNAVPAQKKNQTAVEKRNQGISAINYDSVCEENNRTSKLTDQNQSQFLNFANNELLGPLI